MPICYGLSICTVLHNICCLSIVDVVNEFLKLSVSNSIQ